MFLVPSNDLTIPRSSASDIDRLFIDLLKVRLESSQSANPSPPDPNTVGDKEVFGPPKSCKKSWFSILNPSFVKVLNSTFESVKCCGFHICPVS